MNDIIYKNITNIIFIILAIAMSVSYIKMILLFYPTRSHHTKYTKFFDKLNKLTGSKINVSNYRVKSGLNKFFNKIVLDCVYVANSENKKCIIIFHGNTGNLTMRYNLIKFLYNYASVVIFDYRMFGRSTCDSRMITMDGLKEDAFAIWNFVRDELGFDAQNISFFGESFGCYVATKLASEISKTFNEKLYPQSLIMNSPSYSLSMLACDLIKKMGLPYFNPLLKIFFGNEYNNSINLGYVNKQIKIIIAHSAHDDFVPYQHAFKLYKEIENNNVEMITIEGTHDSQEFTNNYIYALANIFDC